MVVLRYQLHSRHPLLAGTIVGDATALLYKPKHCMMAFNKQDPYDPWRDDVSISVPLCGHCRKMILHQADFTKDRKTNIMYQPDVNSTRISLGQPKPCATCKYAWALTASRMDSLGHTGWEESIIRHAISTRVEEDGTLQYDLQYPPKNRPSGLSPRVVMEVRRLGGTPATSFWRNAQYATPIERLSTARKWLDACRIEHSICRACAEVRPRTYPTRLIKILDCDSVKLVPSAKGHSPSYSALSHCWGSRQPLKTTTQNLLDHMNAVPYEALPKTFQEAILVSLKLGLKYIWIDSLCIVQDDLGDWETEAANMAATYENAELTIAAAWGSNGETGILIDNQEPLNIQVEGYVRERSEVSARTVNLAVRSMIEQGRYVVKAPLNKRKWVLQERLLSLRTLTFAKDQMHWSCPSLIQTEDELGTTKYDHQTANLQSIHFWEVGACEDFDIKYQLQESWENIVRDHSVRQLTFAQDKLATLAGITRAFERVFHQRALLGLWEDDLVRNLLWTTEAGTHPRLDHGAITSLNIPSWSWLKVDGPVQAVTHYGNGPLINITSTTVVWESLPMTSRVKEARIEGQGSIFLVTRAVPSTDRACACHLPAISMQIGEDVEKEFTVYTSYLDECVSQIPDAMYCLFMFDRTVPTRWTLPDDPNIEAGCLLLRKASPSVDEHHYTRLGVLYIHDFPRALLEDQTIRPFVLT